MTGIHRATCTTGAARAAYTARSASAARAACTASGRGPTSAARSASAARAAVAARTADRTRVGFTTTVHGHRRDEHNPHTPVLHGAENTTGRSAVHKKRLNSV